MAIASLPIDAHHQLLFEQDGRQFRVLGPDSRGLWIAAKDILLNRSYEYLPEFELHKHTGLVVDAGAHVGVFSLVAASFAANVISIEPDEHNAAFLKLNLERNMISNVILESRGLSHTEKRVKLFGSENSLNPSLVGTGSNFREIDSVTLAEIIKKYGRIDLLKLNVEGAEFKIIEETPLVHLNDIDFIVAEVHLLFGSIRPILDRLRAAGFKTQWFYEPIYRTILLHKIHVFNARRLKAWRALAYSAARLLNLREQRLCYLFAYRNGSQ